MFRFIHSHKSSPFYFCGPLNVYDISDLDKVPQTLPNCLCSSSLQTFAHLPSCTHCSHFPSVACITVIVVFVTNNNFGNVCISIKVSASLRYKGFCMSCYDVSTVASYFCVQCLAKVFGPLELCDLLPHSRLQT